MNTSLFSKTPTVTVLDNRGLTVRNIAYHRHPDLPDNTDERITRHTLSPRGLPVQSVDSRLFGTGLANFTYLTDLAGTLLRTDSADAGTIIALNDAAGRPFMTVSNIRTADNGTEDHSQAITRTWQYEDVTLPGRPLSITEQTAEGVFRITERFVYAGNTEAEQARNLAGQCVSHYDTAGLVQTDSLALTGIPLFVNLHLLEDADNPDTVVDWQGEDACAWNDLLAAEIYTTLTTTDTTGAVLSTIDAVGNVQRVAYDVAGLLSGSWLTLKGSTEQIIVASLTYSAAGQKLREAHGNGVVTTYTYEPETQRLTGIKTERPVGHTAGAKVLQDLRYEYDPVGNVLKITSDAEKTRFWRNQKVGPKNTYTYDSLYQLVSTTGREMANTGRQSSSHPPVSSFDNAAYTNYTRTYTYDNAANLTQVRHSSPTTNNNYTTVITVCDRSNRSVLSSLTSNPADVDALFTAGGQQIQLLPGQQLAWTEREELSQVTPVQRDDAEDDSESYRYDGSSQRILKVSSQKTAGSMQTQRVLYLPGLELRTTANGGTLKEHLQVICVGEAGLAQVRVLHWESGKPDGLSNEQVRYSYDNLTGSSSLEVDGDGSVISLEEYYPYGGTAIWTMRSQVEADYKTIRYSGKELDATGLYYYGYRYYQPWAGRWLSADPAGTVDGLNLFRMVRNNPVKFRDKKGLNARSNWQKLKEKIPTNSKSVYPVRHGNYRFEQFSNQDKQRGDSRNWKGVEYWSNEKRTQFKVNVVDGKLAWSSGSLVSYPGVELSNEEITHAENWHSKLLAYVLGRASDGKPELNIFPHAIDKRHHSSPYSGNGVLDSGMISVHKGRIAYIENKSGHYRPNLEQKLHTLNFFKKEGVSLDDTFISEWHELNRKDVEFLEFMEENLYKANDFVTFYQDRTWRAGQDSNSNNRLLPLPIGMQPDSVDMSEDTPPRLKDKLFEVEFQGLAALTMRSWNKDARPVKMSFTAR